MRKEDNLDSIRKIIRVGGRLKELTVVKDEDGNVVHKMLSPIMLEFRPKDIIQVMVGATILAIPVSYTEEVWNIGATIPLSNLLLLMLLSVSFIATFVYYTYYRRDFKNHYIEFIKRVVSTYVFSFAIVSLILFLIGQAPWATDWLLAFKRAVIVTLPASMSAVIADTIK